MDKKDIYKILKDKRFQWAVTILILLIVAFWTSSIRLSNWDLLTDQTTGEKIPLALDPYYFLRHAEVLQENGGAYPTDIDGMRYPLANISYTSEIMPQATYFIYKVANIFGAYTIQEVNVFSPVLFYFVGLILFFLLSYVLTRSKSASVIGSVLLAFVPSYLYRTMAGFSDHESIGMMAFFAVLLVYSISLKYLDNRKALMNIFLFGLGTAILSAFLASAWGGAATLMYMIIPLSFLIFWLTKLNYDKEFAKRGILFYASWLILSPIIGYLVLNYPLSSFIKRFLLNSQGLLGPAILLIVIIDFLIIKNKDKLKFIKEKYRAGYSFGISAIIGIILLSLLGENIFSLISGLWNKIFTPWGTGRIGLTVAESAQPFLVDWINQVSPIIFWMFFAGIIMIGINFAKEIKNKKIMAFTMFIWILMISGVLFSRISATSLMQGTNFISQLFYIGSLAIAGGFFIWLYFNEKFKLSSEMVIIISWMFLTLIGGRASIRTFFTLTPFVTFAIGFLIFKIYQYFHSKKDELIRPIMIVLLIVAILAGAYSLYNFENAITAQSKATGPSANYQWQGAMSWVRENTPEGAVFNHWWDYGYWVQYLGKRPSVTDGGHAVNYWDHLVGRYVLTTTKPETAYSFFKTHNVSYFLIDPTEIGKYPAYSRIGSGVEGIDRYSAIPTMVMDKKQTIEKANETIVVYQGGVFIDEDIEYTLQDGKKIFLPREKAAIGGVIWKLNNVAGGATSNFDRPTGVFFYNGQRYDIPIRYIYVEDELIDMGSGIEAVIRMIPQFDGQGMSPLGALIYLSPKVSKGFMAQNYLLGNAFGGYEDLELAHVEYDAVVQSLKAQGAPVKEFAYYNGFRGPIKIWKVNYPEGTLAKEEFLRRSGEYAEFDNLEFVEA